MTATFSVTRDDVITKALQLCEALGAGEAASTNDLTDCSMMLQAMLKYWNTKGYQAWCYQLLTFPCVIAQASYTIGESGANVNNPRPIRVAQAWTQDANQLVQPLSPMSRQQYFNLSPRNAPGPANSYYYDPQIPNGVFYAWTLPVDASRSYYLSIQRPINDISSGSATFDVPQEGFLALMWGLAEEVKTMYGTSRDTQAVIAAKAAEYIEVFSDFAQEDGNTYFMPSYERK